MLEQVMPGWLSLIRQEAEKDYFKNLMTFIEEEYKNKNIYPPRNMLFQAFEYTDYEQVKAVIIGQDPYHGQGQAHGLSFSVQKGVKLPPSLRNIYKELEEDVGQPQPFHGYLGSWARDGVLLLNTVLSVEEGKPNSHKGQGWETFTEQVLIKLNQRKKPLVFILWGKHAQAKRDLIDESLHAVIQSPHPSPFSARKGFYGSKPFSKTNEILRAKGQTPINWSLEDGDETNHLK